MEEAYMSLIEAIIRKASKDYQFAVKKLAKNPDNWQAQDLLREVEEFFRSDWFEMMTGADGERLLERMHEWVTR